MPGRVAKILVAFGLLAGCAAENAGNRHGFGTYSYFSYLNGEDIRADCAEGQANQARFIYHAMQSDQIRTYDLMSRSGKRQPVLKIRSLGPAQLADLTLDKPFIGWRGTVVRYGLGRSAYLELIDSLKTSGVMEAPAVGESFSSDDYYWVVVACLDGKIVFNVFRYGSEPFNALTFPNLLLRRDPIGIPLGKPGDGRGPSGRYQSFELEVGETGFRMAAAFNLFKLF